MSPDDPRHGTRAGYLAHRAYGTSPCRRCLDGRSRQDKRLRVDHHRQVQMTYTHDEVLDLIAPWLTMGVSCSALGNAAGVSAQSGNNLGARIEAGHFFRRGTYVALSRVTESELNPRSLVYADLTRSRIFSLMADGHQLSSIPVLATGPWRRRHRVTIALAARIRDHYAAVQHTPGRSDATRTQATRSGHLPPAGWDDPGTLAWPLGWTVPLAPPTQADPVVVSRILAGDWQVPASREERLQVAQRWAETGRPLAELSRQTGWKIERYFRAGDTAA